MKSRLLIAVGAVVLTVVGMTLAQPTPTGHPPLPAAPGHGHSAVPPAVVPSTGPAWITPNGKPEVKPEDLTIEQLLDAVEKFREQKAEIEKKEKAYMKLVHQKAGKLKERIDGIEGVVPPTSPPLINTTGGAGIPAPGGQPGPVPPGSVPPGVVPRFPPAPRP